MVSAMAVVLVLAQAAAPPTRPGAEGGAAVRTRAEQAPAPPALQRFELVLAPASLQLDGVWAQHVGTTASLLVHVHERFAVTLSEGYLSWFTARSAAAEVEQKLSVTQGEDWRPTWSVLAGAEIAPGQGTLALGDGEAELRFVVTGALGATVPQFRARRAFQGRPAFVGDASPAFSAQVGVGLRVKWGHFAIRAELNDLIVTGGSATTVNGCTRSEASAAFAGPASRSTVARGCDAASFDTGQLDRSMPEWLAAFSPRAAAHYPTLSLAASVSF